jgi:hypothetical protein
MTEWGSDELHRRFIMTDGATKFRTTDHRCQNSWFGSHKFEARYDLGPADLAAFQSISGIGTGQFMERLRAKTYVRDVCTKCGKTIERVK